MRALNMAMLVVMWVLWCMMAGFLVAGIVSAKRRTPLRRSIGLCLIAAGLALVAGILFYVAR